MRQVLVICVAAFAGWYAIGGMGIIFGGLVGAMVLSESEDDEP